ncbi:MAG: GNAT family N-acetyltransferase [Bacteriovoracaceae bacterium]|nr:GNAT family N-acetyltransferase [Bacteriovoracaceae bacterium]
MIFETERFVIRDLLASDYEIVHELVQEPKIYQYQVWGPNSKEDTLNYLNCCIAQQSSFPRHNYEMAIIERSTNAFVGTIAIRVKDTINKKAEIGYWVKYSKWGQGYATEATRALLKFGFNQLHLNKISATVSPENIGSVTVLKKVSMRKVGILESDLLVRGVFRDSILLEITNSAFLEMPSDEDYISR